MQARTTLSTSSAADSNPEKERLNLLNSAIPELHALWHELAQAGATWRASACKGNRVHVSTLAQRGTACVTACNAQQQQQPTFTQVLNCSAGNDLSLDAGRVLMQVTVVMPCLRLTIFSPCVCSMMYFLLHANRTAYSILGACTSEGAAIAPRHAHLVRPVTLKGAAGGPSSAAGRPKSSRPASTVQGRTLPSCGRLHCTWYPNIVGSPQYSYAHWSSQPVTLVYLSR